MQTIFEYMALLVLRVFYIIKDNKKMRIFLISILNI
jgi:hypothetical protein